jgi:molybdopterin synthase sulfur carrier subunit
MATVFIPIPLRKFTGGSGEVTVGGANVDELIEHLEGEYPGIRDKLCTKDGTVKPFVNMYLNNEDIRFLQNLQTPVRDGDELLIVPALAGGLHPRR